MAVKDIKAARALARAGTDKGHSKSKNKAVDQFDGWCNKCGKYGHRAKPCWHVQERSIHEVSRKQTEEIYEQGMRL